MRYHGPVHSLAERVLDHIRRQELLRAGDRVGVAVSGGIDSVALLRLLLELRTELGIVLSVVHFNHKLRGAESDADQEFVSNLAREYDLEFYADWEDVAEEAAREHISVEAAARDVRYGFFHHLLGEDHKCGPQGLKPSGHEPLLRGPEGPLFHATPLSGTAKAAPFPASGLRANPAARATPVLTRIATGHTLDDQAETVLLHAIRGTGLKGLGGIHPRIHMGDDNRSIVRPLLGIRRRELEQYLKDLNQPWREDSSNASSKFTRNRLRQLVLPLLEREFNPAVAENLAELSEIARGEEKYWENKIAGWLGTSVDGAKVESARFRNTAIGRDKLLTEPIAVQRRLIKAIGDHAGIPLEFKHVEEILSFAAGEHPSGKVISLPLGWKVKRESKCLIFVMPKLCVESERPGDYEYELALPGRVTVPEAATVIDALRITAESRFPGYNPEHLFDADLLHGTLKVRNWRPGDRFWPAHTKSPRKIKELLQERQIAQPQRKLWPVIANGDEIIWVRGFSVPSKWQAKPDRGAILIRETPLKEDSET